MIEKLSSVISLPLRIFFCALLLSSCALEEKKPVTAEQARVDYELLLNLPTEPLSYEKEIKPILEQRCVVCHGCYDAPCQLKLSSPEGIERGADKNKVYDGARILPMEPTRLFVDAKSTEQWRAKGFTPVLNEGESDPELNLSNSVLYRMLRLKQMHPQARVGMLPESFDLGLDREQECPTAAEFDDFASRHPTWGMPYAMPNLRDDDYGSLVRWLAQGSPMPEVPGVSPRAAGSVRQWEQFLNGDSLKQQLMSRYLYEHLFLAHLHLDGTPEREFYRLVRSSTPSGQSVDEIATLRPYEDPGEGAFYYRLQRYHPSIVAKDHVVYALSPARMQRYRQLFLEPDYQVSAWPSYEAATASNPFKVFEPIPPESRYRFLLDDARFFIEGFIKGPVCRGQVALNVIEDQFWVMFFNPDRKLPSTDPAFLDEMSDYLQLPIERGDTLNIFSIWTDYWERQKNYMSAREAFFKQVHERDLDNALDYIWDGDGSNPNAALTVFRHFDSASVNFGLLGEYPETAWVIDYPLLERIHYLLVAGFDVYGNVGHQLTTRIYMDFLRMEGENYFLVFLPTSHRKAIRDSWYQGARERVQKMFEAPSAWLAVESVSGFETDDPQRELYRHLERRLAAAARLDVDLDRCVSEGCRKRHANSPESRADRAMERIAAVQGEHLVVFPDVSFLRVKAESGDLAYSFIRNKAYKSVTSMLEDAERRDESDRQHDSLSVLKWLEGSYPNFFFETDLQHLDDFTERYAAIRTRKDYEKFVALYGVRRTNQRFWEIADWFHEQSAREQPILSGLFDLNRYRNR